MRELKHTCERAVVFGGDPITPLDLGLVAAPPTHGAGVLRLSAVESSSLKDLKAVCEREFILYVVEQEDWNLAASARRLGLQRTYLHAKLSALGIVRPTT